MSEQANANESSPTVDELRTTAKTLRKLHRALKEVQSGWPLWKRLLMDYQERKQCMELSAKMDSMADCMEEDESK